MISAQTVEETEKEGGGEEEHRHPRLYQGRHADGRPRRRRGKAKGRRAKRVSAWGWGLTRIK